MSRSTGRSTRAPACGAGPVAGQLRAFADWLVRLQGRRAARDRRAAARAGARGRQAGPAGPGLHRHDGELLQVDQRCSTPRSGRTSAGRGWPGTQTSRRVLGRRRAALPGGAAGSQPGRAGVRAAMGRDHADRLPRRPGRRARSWAGSRRPLIRVVAGCRAPAATAIRRTTSTTRSPGMVRTVRDGKYRALDTVCLRQVLGAVQAVVATHAEAG